MSNKIEDARINLNKYYSMLVKELNRHIKYYENEKEEINKCIKEYQDIVYSVDNEINIIKKNKDNFIGKGTEENDLLPEKLHEVQVLDDKRKFYENVVNYLKSKKASKLSEFDVKIDKCKKTIDKYNSDIEIVKQAIWRDGVIKIKIKEIVDLKELNEYVKKNEELLNFEN